MGNALAKFIPNFIAKFAANPSEKSLFFFEPNKSKYRVSKRYTNADYQKILCDDEISAALDTRLDTMLSMPWTLTGNKKDKNNEFLWNILNDHIYSLIAYSWWAVFFGKSAFQVVYVKKGSDILIDRVYDEDYQQFSIVKGVWYHNSKPFPEGKYFVTTNKPSAMWPEGSGLADKLINIYSLRYDGWCFYMKYLEKFGVPFFKIELGENVSEDDRALMKAFLESDRPKGAIFPNGTTLDTVDGRTSSVGIFDSFETIMRERIQRVILGQTLTSGTGETGSLALGEVHERVAANKSFSDSIMIEKTINDVVRSLFELNKMTGEIPEFEFASPKGIQKDVADRDWVLKEIGVTFTKDYFVDTYEFDETQIDYEVPEPTDNTGGFKAKLSRKEKKQFISQELLKSRASEAEKLEKKYIDESPNLGAVLDQLVKSAKSKEDLQKKLASFIRKGTPEFDEALTEAMLRASVLGGKDVEEV